MAIQQTKKQSDLEKRLRLLRQQVYGKSSDQLGKTQKTRVSEYQITRISETLIPRYTDTPTYSGSIRTDAAYLRQDLLKITLLATSAIGIQLILFVLSRNHILNLNFF